MTEHQRTVLFQASMKLDGFGKVFVELGTASRHIDGEHAEAIREDIAIAAAALTRLRERLAAVT